MFKIHDNGKSNSHGSDGWGSVGVGSISVVTIGQWSVGVSVSVSWSSSISGWCSVGWSSISGWSVL